MSYMPSVTGIENGNTVGTADEVVTLQGGWLYRAFITGTWNSASAQPKMVAPDGTWCSFGDALTADGIVNIEAPSGAQITVGVTGGDGSTSIDIQPTILRNR